MGVDGGSDRAVGSGFEIDMIIGDMDSVGLQDSAAARIPLEDQQSSDLQKRLNTCAARGTGNSMWLVLKAGWSHTNWESGGLGRSTG